MTFIALYRILETVVTFHSSGGKVYSMNKGCHTCMIKHTMHVQSLHCSAYLTGLDVCIYVPRSHIHFLKMVCLIYFIVSEIYILIKFR